MSIIARPFYLVALLSLTGCVTSWESGYRPTENEIADIYTAAIRFRLATDPLPAHRQLDIFLNLAVVPGLPARLSEYQVRVRRGGADPRAGALVLAPSRPRYIRQGFRRDPRCPRPGTRFGAAKT